MYIYVVKKNEGHIGVSPVLNLVQNYVTKFGKNDFFVSIPGYLSVSKKSMDIFCDEFPRKVIGNQIKNQGYFFQGMNGTNMLKGSSLTIQNYINRIYGNFSSITTPQTDHSKTIIFFESLNLNIYETIEDFIENANVKAILIGSSNQSYYTYIHSPSSKGETDILLVDESVESFLGTKISDNSAVELINLNDENFIVVSKSLKVTKPLRDVANEILGY